MTLAAAVALWVSSFANVFLMVFQSRNVHAGRYAWAGATSFMLTAAQLVFVRAAASDIGTLAFLAIAGTAGPAGVVACMWLTRSLIRR